MKRITVLLCLFLISFSVKSQSLLQNKAEEFKALYNAKSYDQIYAMLSDDYKKTLPEKDFVKFLSADIFSAFGDLEKNDFNSAENKNSFIGFFQKGKLIITMKCNESGAVNYIEFLPYYEQAAKKRNNYLSDNKMQTGLDTLVDRLVGTYMQSPENCGLSIGIYCEGKKFFYNYGEKKRDENTITDKETTYEIGSLTKVFCGVLLAQAILEKKVNAEDDIRKFLPLGNYKNLEVKGSPIRLIHLANHTSGLPRIPDDIEKQKNYNPMDPYKNYNRNMVFDYLKTVTLNSEPGTKHDYSNTGMALLGILLEKVYEKSLDELISEKISGPLAMKNTFINPSEKNTARLASGYNAHGIATSYWNMNDLAAAGGIKSCTSDLLEFLIASANQTTPALLLASTPTFNSGKTLGMAWHIMKTKQGNTLTWHNGGTFGFSAFMGFVNEKKCAVVVLSNSGNVVDFISLGILKHLQK